jgi:hypothetical protein
MYDKPKKKKHTKTLNQIILDFVRKRKRTKGKRFGGKKTIKKVCRK